MRSIVSLLQWSVKKAKKARSLSPTSGALCRIAAIAVGIASEDGDQLLKMKTKLSTSMNLTQFDNGYWYIAELKELAETIGIPSANKLRKDELETAIKYFLKTGKIKSLTKRNLSTPGPKDVELGLSLDLPVVVYTNDKETKAFLDREAQKLAPGLKRKSGARYRLNRWREEQLVKGVKLTYGDLVKEYIRLNQTDEPFAQIPQDRYINFLSDFLAAEKGATRAQAIKAWEQLKTLDIPKNYRSWAKSQSSNSR
jgi:hypothetical protein